MRSGCVCMLLPQDQRPDLTWGTKEETQHPPAHFWCLLPHPREKLENAEPWDRVGGRRRKGDRLVFKGVTRETQSVFPSPAESKGFSLLGEWLTLGVWLDGCLQEPAQSSLRLLHCSSQSGRSTGNVVVCPTVLSHPQPTLGTQSPLPWERFSEVWSPSFMPPG